MSGAIIVRNEIGKLDLPAVLAGAPMAADLEDKTGTRPKPLPPVFINHLALPDRGIVCGAARVDVGEGRWAPRAGLDWRPVDDLVTDVTCWNCREAVDA